MSKILVVEDEIIIRTALRKLLTRHKHEVTEAGSVSEAASYSPDSFDLIISDLRLPGAPGTDMIKLAGDTPVLIMTSYASLRSAVDSMRLGAVDYIAKPFDHDEMIAAVKRVINKSRVSKAMAPDTQAGSKRRPQGMDSIIGMSNAMKAVFSNIEKVAPTQARVLITGETGTGKELVAHAIHNLSPRAGKKIICVNCAAIPETLIESELFGHEKGAFTGATAGREGLVAAADGGTLFLDEIGELPLEAQARLLRVLQEGEVRAIGSTEARRVNVRLIAATHRNLARLAAEGKFREDLYFRINVVQLKLPPLRERGKDILILAENFLERYCGEAGREPIPLSPEAIQAITTYVWPGNIRELENAMQRAVIMSEGDSIGHEALAIDLDLVPVSDTADDKPRLMVMTQAPQKEEPAEDLSLEDYFQRFVLEHQDTMSETELAKKLGVSRKCLWERRQKLGIPRSRAKSSGA